MTTKGAKKKELPAGLVMIEKLAYEYQLKWADVVMRVANLNQELKAVKRRHIKGIRETVTAAKEARAALYAAIEESKDLFAKPRTRVFHGVQVGFRKLIGKITWADSDQVVKLIKKVFPDRVSLMVKTTETPVKETLEQLTAADLKKIGVSVGEDTDVVVLKNTDSDVDKIVDALLTDEPGGGDA